MSASREPANQGALPTPVPDRAVSTVTRLADGLVLGVARHWLLLINLAVAVYLLLPFLAPWLMRAGFTTPARFIYTIYSFACHQLPERSYFLFGQQPVYSLPTLENNGLAAGLDLFARRKFVGNPILGYKVAICQRDVAIYGSVLLGGLLFGLVRSRLRPLSLKVYALFLIPIALDGGTQLLGLRSSTWWLRLITGALFGLASVWLAYPYLEASFQDAIRTEMRRRARRAQAQDPAPDLRPSEPG